MDHVVYIAAAIVALPGAVLSGLLVFNLVRPSGFWPADPGWRRDLTLWLFRAYAFGMVGVAGVALWVWGLGQWPRYAIGLPMMGGAYALSLWAYKGLGKDNTYFGSDGLVTVGLYAYSRNPGYVASLAAALGLAVVAGSVIVLALAGGLLAIYFLFALNEERWLAKGYGTAFLRYMVDTPRFVDARTVARAREDLLTRL